MGFRGLLYALVACIFLGTSMECLADTNHRELERLEDQMPNLVTASIIWEDCGDWNGYYYWALDMVTMCTENDALEPGAQRMILLHELGHAYSEEYDMDFSRWDGSREDEADEFAAVMTLVHGRPEDLLTMARLWDKWGKEHGVIPGDTHSPASVRAARLRSMYWGYQMRTMNDYFYFKDCVGFWHEQFLYNAQWTQ